MGITEELTKIIGENDSNQGVSDWLTTGILPLNYAMSGRYDGGFPVGRISEVYGPPSCLAAETYIRYDIRDRETGKRQNHKGGSIERLYERFHKIERKGKGYYQRDSTIESDFFVQSMDDDGFIRLNKVTDVLMNGEKECFRLTTKMGYSIVATADHRFFNGETYVKLQDLAPGDTVFIHNSTQLKYGKSSNVSRRAWMVKHHPVAPDKVVDGKYTYKRIGQSRAIKEAEMNGLSPEEYRERLNSGDIEGLVFLNKGDHVHHLDEDYNNDDPANLVIIGASEHGKLHMIERTDNMRYFVQPYQVVKVESVGVRKVYDIKMSDPFRNYVANKFVVHNCGKTLLATLAMIQTQKKGGIAALFDYEHAFSIDRALGLGLKADTDQWIYKQPRTAEEGFGMIQKMCEMVRRIDPERHVTVVVDSTASMVTEEEMKAGFDGVNMKTRLSLASFMSTGLKLLEGIISRTNVTMIFLNQVRDNPGVMFGDKETTPGGNAQKFYASLRVRLRKSEKVKAESGEVLGEHVHALVIKNKVYRPFVEAKYISSFTEGVDLVQTHIDALNDAGALGKTKGWMKLDGKSYRPTELAALCREDAALYDRLLGMFGSPVEEEATA